MQDLYKQAIADAKALRASAIANAKASLQETFAPQVEALVKQSLREEAEDEAEEKQVKKESKNGAYTQNVKVKKAPIKEEELEEDLEEGLDEELEEDLEESTLEEILGELEELEMEEDEDSIDEDDMENMEEAEDDMEDDEHEEPDADNMGGPSDHDADNAEEGEDDEEIVLTFGQLKQALAPFIGGEEGMDDTDAEEADVDLDEILGEDDLEEDLEEGKYKMEEKKNQMQEKKHKKEMDEAKKAVEEMRHSLQEVNLLNAKLLYMNKIFKSKSLNESQKKRVVGAFDRASNVKEVKNIFATLNESITAPKKQLSESFSYASKPMGYAPKQNITEADPFISRMQKLAGIIK